MQVQSITSTGVYAQTSKSAFCVIFWVLRGKKEFVQSLWYSLLFKIFSQPESFKNIRGSSANFLALWDKRNPAKFLIPPPLMFHFFFYYRNWNSLKHQTGPVTQKIFGIVFVIPPLCLPTISHPWKGQHRIFPETPRTFSGQKHCAKIVVHSLFLLSFLTPETSKGPPYDFFQYCETKKTNFQWLLYGLLKILHQTDGQRQLWAALSLLFFFHNQQLTNKTFNSIGAFFVRDIFFLRFVPSCQFSLPELGFFGTMKSGSVSMSDQCAKVGIIKVLLSR